ncbi:hypothetical protein ACFE04_027318 [Oxalis oulophora]
MGIISKAPILPKDLGINKEKNGGLIVVGSYVPKTTKQVEQLKLRCGWILRTIEVSVDQVAMKSLEEREVEISRTAELADVYLGAPLEESLDINFKVSSTLVDIVKRITMRPRYILAKLQKGCSYSSYDYQALLQKSNPEYRISGDHAESVKELHNARSTFEQAQFNLVTALSNVEAKKRFEVLEAVSGTMDPHLRYFKQGYELLHRSVYLKLM